MKKHSNGIHRGSLTELNITPLLDLVFVLLIIFMITTPLMEQQIDIHLPESRPQTTSKEVDAKSVRQVNIDSIGRIYFVKDRVDAAELERRLVAFKNSDPDAAVALHADANLKYQQIVQVLDAIRAAGVRLALSTVPES